MRMVFAEDQSGGVQQLVVQPDMGLGVHARRPAIADSCYDIAGVRGLAVHEDVHIRRAIHIRCDASALRGNALLVRVVRAWPRCPGVDEESSRYAMDEDPRLLRVGQLVEQNRAVVIVRW